MSTQPISNTIGLIPGTSIPTSAIFNLDNQVVNKLLPTTLLALNNQKKNTTPIKPKPNTTEVQSAQSKPKPKYTTDFFKIIFKNNAGESKSFVFSLLPAIEAHTQLNNPGNKVPGVMPGIAITTKMRQRGIVVPGSTPVYQSIGVESMTMPLYGAFLGGEKIEVDSGYTGSSLPSGDLKLSGNAQVNGFINDAYTVAEYFNNNIVLPSRAVTVEIHTINNPTKFIRNNSYLDAAEVGSSTYIVYTGLISQFKPMVVKGDRCYYCIDLSITKFPSNFQKPKLDEVAVVNSGTSNVAAPTSTTDTSNVPVPVPTTDTVTGTTKKEKTLKILRFSGTKDKLQVLFNLDGHSVSVDNFNVIPGTLYSVIINEEESKYTVRIVLTKSIKSKTDSDKLKAIDLVKGEKYSLDSVVKIP